MAEYGRPDECEHTHVCDLTLVSDLEVGVCLDCGSDVEREGPSEPNFGDGERDADGFTKWRQRSG